MRVFPEFQGPMASWPQVVAEPGAKETLDILRSSYTLAVVTNAADSGAAQVFAALERAGLGRAISAVFTARELGSAKPDPAYFYGVLKNGIFWRRGVQKPGQYGLRNSDGLGRR